jgi:type II secretory pathway pseudopilin PulG
MTVDTVEAKDCRPLIAAGKCAARARTETAAFVRAYRGFERGGPVGNRALESGFTYIGVLVLIAMMGIALVVVSGLWQAAQKREKEQELLFIGNEFRQAIAAYNASRSAFPQKLEDLLKDPGFPGVRRFLRKVYRDPMTGRAEWGLMRPDGNAIVGVFSLSDAEPLKQHGFRLADQSFEAKNKYSEWVFIASGAQGKPAASLTPVPGAGQGSAAVTAAPPAQESAGAASPANPDAIPASPSTQGSAGANSPANPDIAPAVPATPGSAGATSPPNSNTTPTDEGRLPTGRSGSRGRR